MAAVAGNINKVYIRNNDSSVLSQLSKAVCVLLPGSFMIAGFNDKGEVLVIDRMEGIGNPSEPDFLQSELQNKSLQNLLKKVTAVFTGYDKHLLVPRQLYNQTEAEQWLRKLYFIEKDEVIVHTKLKDDKTWMLHTLHLNLSYMLENRFAKAKFLPLSAYQFHKHPPQHFIQCCITETHVYATAYLNKALCWHKVFAYSNAEDIAYMFGLLLKEHGIESNNVNIECTTGSIEAGSIVEGLQSYFPQLKDGSAENEWKGIIYLMEQLYICA